MKPSEAHCSCNEGRVVSMSRIPIAPVKDPNGLVIFSRKTSKKADESNFIVNLAQSEQTECDSLQRLHTLSSGLEDMMEGVVKCLKQIKVALFICRASRSLDPHKRQLGICSGDA